MALPFFIEWTGFIFSTDWIFRFIKKKREATIRQVNVSILEQSCQDISRMVLYEYWRLIFMSYTGDKGTPHP